MTANTEVIVAMPNGRILGEEQNAERMQVIVHIQAETLTPNVARRRANLWLTMNAGHLLKAKNPELLLGTVLHWRFDVFLSVPQLEHPGSITENRIGQIRLDAITGEVVETVKLIEELKANASAVVAG